MEFTKAHGTANDFVVLEDLDDALDLPDVLVRALCDRRRGVGADGVIRLGAPPAGADVTMDHRNADGSRPETCGNGVRVVAKYVVDHGLVVPDDTGTVRVATRAGVRDVVVHPGPAGDVAEVAVDMGVPLTTPADVPFEAVDDAALHHPIDVDGTTVDVAVVSMGNPHAVVIVDDVATAPVGTLGPAIETHRRFPAKANVGFAEVVDEHRIRLRVWERGVGETAACGTGACAAVVALQRLGGVGEEVAVRLPGGTLSIRHAGAGPVTMTGPAVEVSRGVVTDAWLAAALRAELEA